MLNSAPVSGRQRLSVETILIKDIDLLLAGLLFFDPTGGTDNPIFSYYKYCITVYFFFKYIKTLPLVALPVAILGVFSALLAFSTWQNTQSPSWAFSGFMFGIQIISLLLVFVEQCRRLSTETVLRRITCLFILALFINDVAMICLPYNRDDSGTLYLLGNKFGVSYSHCLLVGLLMVVQKGRYGLIRCAAAVGLVMNYYSGSSTGAIMMAVMLALTFVPDKLKLLISNPIAVMTLVAVLNVLMWGAVDLLHNPYVQDFIVNVLGKSADLTGRDRLYNATLEFVSQKPWLGWGYLTNIYRTMFGYGNAQNGLFHLVTQAGILGTVAYFSGLYYALGGKESHGADYFGIYAFLFAMAIGSLVEINLSFQFAFGVVLLCGALHGGSISES